MKPMVPTRRQTIGWAAALLGAPVTAAWTIPFAAAAVSIPSEFRGNLKRAKLRLDTSVLHDFDSVRVLPNPHFEYDVGVRHNRINFEIRYTVRNVAHIEKDINKSRGKPGTVVVPFENFIQSDAETVVLNISRESNPPRDFDPDAVRAEFGANWGMTSGFVPRPTFAKHPNGLYVAIYRHDVRTFAYMIYLYEAKAEGGMTEEVNALLERTFYALRFGA